jgi:hypothetical protein
MGISDKHHFNWLKSAAAPLYSRIRTTLSDSPRILGLGEHHPNPLLQDLFQGSPPGYVAADLFSQTSEVITCDINDLTPIMGNPADVVCCFRASYFLRGKSKFFEQMRHVVKGGGWLFMDFLIGSSDLPVIGFDFGNGKVAAIYDRSKPSVFKTTFFDDRLVDEFPTEVEEFCSHARRWPLRTRVFYLRTHPASYLQHSRRLRDLGRSSLGQHIKSAYAAENVVSLADFERNGFAIELLHAHYFYPHVKKFNLYNLVVARRVD